MSSRCKAPLPFITTKGNTMNQASDLLSFAAIAMAIVALLMVIP